MTPFVSCSYTNNTKIKKLDEAFAQEGMFYVGVPHRQAHQQS